MKLSLAVFAFFLISHYTLGQNLIEEIVFSEEVMKSKCRSKKVFSEKNTELMQDCLKVGFYHIENIFSDLVGCDTADLREFRSEKAEFCYNTKRFSVEYSRQFLEKGYGLNFHLVLYSLLVIISHEYGHHLFYRKFGLSKSAELRSLSELFSDFVSYVLTKEQSVLPKAVNLFFPSKSSITNKRNFEPQTGNLNWRDFYEKYGLFYSEKKILKFLEVHALFATAYPTIGEVFSVKKIEGNEVPSIERMLSLIKKFVSLHSEEIDGNEIKNYYDRSDLEKSKKTVGYGQIKYFISVLSEEDLRREGIYNIRKTILKLANDDKLEHTKKESLHYLKVSLSEILPPMMMQFSDSFKDFITEEEMRRRDSSN